MNIYTALVLHNIGLFILIGFVIYFTGSPWGLLGLLFLSGTSETNKEE